MYTTLKYTSSDSRYHNSILENRHLNNNDDGYNDDGDNSCSENGDEDFSHDRHGDDGDDDDMECCETPVPAKYRFKARHVERLMGKNPWCVHNETNGLSTCLACRSSPNANGRNLRCKLRDGT